MPWSEGVGRGGRLQEATQLVETQLVQRGCCPMVGQKWERREGELWRQGIGPLNEAGWRYQMQTLEG